MKYLNKTMGCLLLLLIAAGGVGAQRKELPAYFSKQHREVLQKWLAKNPHLRVASEKDCGRCENEIANQRKVSGANYHPYYTVGDFNGDGKEDFAVALIETKVVKRKRVFQKFAVAVFNAPFSRGKATPAFYKDDLNLRDGGLFFDTSTPQPNRLFVGLFGNDERLTLIPQGQKYVGQ